MSGRVSIAPQRLTRLTINKNERDKLLKELDIAYVLARHGYQVHLVEEDSRTGSYDALIDGIPADFKRTKSHYNIQKYASKAIHHQKAKIMVFQFDADTPAIHWEIESLVQKRIRIIYFFSDRPTEVFDIKQPRKNRG